ncbi:fused response regulator/phosphatase [Candidatus Poribacteria bacterium]|nr:fused response regulator/phosphatase [Candidatus Poribacteria bacterium]
MAGSKGHILIVDDNEFNRELLVQDLEDNAYEVETASNGMEALESIERSLPAMVLLDVMMPGLSGIQVCQTLRSKHRTQELPIIMVTARADAQDVVAGLRAGANDYVTKPIDIDVLLARMETHLKLRDLQAEARRQNERLLRELTAARAVQESLLPNAARLDGMPGSYGVRFASMWNPGEMLGGDFWDLVSLADGSLGLLLIDFAGSGVVSSLNTFRLKTFLQGQCTGLYNAGLTMGRLNAQLVMTLGEYELATAHYVRYNPDRYQLTIAAAGAPYPLIYRARTGDVEMLAVTGLPAGAFSEAAFDETSVVLEVGDKVLYYTDGVLKFGSNEGGYYSQARLRDLLGQFGALEPGEIIKRLNDDLAAFSELGGARDDLTAVVMEVVN